MLRAQARMGGLSEQMWKMHWLLGCKSAHNGGGPGRERFVPHNAMRRVIAERLQLSKQTAPHFYLTVDCEIDALLSARKALNEAAADGVKISVNDMVVKAAAAALMEVPDVNGYFEEEGCRYFSTADIV